LAVTIFIRTK